MRGRASPVGKTSRGRPSGEFGRTLFIDRLQGPRVSSTPAVWAYPALEAQLNNGRPGPVGQNILERSWAWPLVEDDWSLLGMYSDQFTSERMDFFRCATLTPEATAVALFISAPFAE